LVQQRSRNSIAFSEMSWGLYPNWNILRRNSIRISRYLALIAKEKTYMDMAVTRGEIDTNARAAEKLSMILREQQCPA
jgi:hypothetical protein